MRELKRRDFIKYSGWGLATIIVGCGGGGGGGGDRSLPIDDGIIDGGGPPGDPVETLRFTITDAVKEMITHQQPDPNRPENIWSNPAECYFWVFQEERFPADSPGPQIYATMGDLIGLEVTNELDGPHAFHIPGPRPGDPPIVDTGPIQPGETWIGQFTAGPAGTYLYHDNLNAPVNRVMGLHGAFIVMPAEASGARFTPYDNPTPAVQALFDDFGSRPWWPGLAWEEGDGNSNSRTPPFRQYVWLTHQASPVLFDEVGQFARDNPGQDYPAADFVQAFTRDPFINTSNDPRSSTNDQYPDKRTEFNRKPTFFTINGQSGFFGHHNPAINPFHRVGEPTVVRILNAGLMVHSMHLHANHFYVTAIDNTPQENPLWIDVHSLHPMEHLDYVVPFMRPPDVPNVRGIGRADTGLATLGGLTRTWPPVEEMDLFFPPQGSVSNDGKDLAMRQSPLCYPMHDHSEPSQTAAGGSYNCGLMAGMYFIGDRSEMMNFPMEHEFEMMLNFGNQVGETGRPTGDWPYE